MASIHGTVSTILAVHSSAPCSPCMNCDSDQFWVSIESWVHSLSSHFSNGVPLKSTPWRSISMRRMSEIALANSSWSTSIDQSRSVSPFHCECLAFS